MTIEKYELFLEKLIHSVDMGRFISENIAPENFENFISEKFESELTSSNLNRLNCLDYIYRLLQTNVCTHKTESFAGDAYIKQKDSLLADSEKLKNISQTIGKEYMLYLYQWCQIIAFALEFKPDYVFEIGGMKKRTSAMLDFIASKLSAKQLLPKQISPNDRIMIYFCTDNVKKMKYLLSEILPTIRSTVNSVIFHGYSNLLVMDDEESRSYHKSEFVYNDIVSSNINSSMLFDFVSRNKLTLFSADNSFQMYKKKLESYDGQLFSTSANWVWLTLNEANDTKKIYFPK